MSCSRMILKTFLSLCWIANALPPFLAAQQSDPAELPSPEAIIDRYIEAIGSEMGLRSIESLSLEADFEGIDRGSGKMFLNAAGGDWHYDFQTTDGRIVYQMCDDGSSWENQYGSIGRLTGQDRVKFEEIVPVINGPLRWLDYPGEMETTGIEDVRGHKCYVIEFRPEGGDSVRRFFDLDRGLMVRMSYVSNGTRADWYLRDYQEVEGFTIPLIREQYFSDSQAYVVKTTKIVINEEVDQELFAPPSEMDTDPLDGGEDDPFGGGGSR